MSTSLLSSLEKWRGSGRVKTHGKLIIKSMVKDQLQFRNRREELKLVLSRLLRSTKKTRPSHLTARSGAKAQGL